MAKGIIYLKKTQWSLYDPILPNTVTTPYPSSAVNTMDVLNSDELEASITSIFTVNKLTIPSTYTVILSKEILFVKEFSTATSQSQDSPHTSSTDAHVTDKSTTPKPAHQDITIAEKDALKATQDKEIETFIDHVPFEDVGSKTIPLPTGRRVIAANQALYMVYKRGLKKLSHSIDLVLPEVFFPESHLETGLTADAAKILLTKTESFRQYDMLPKQIDATPHFITNTPENPQKEKKKTLILITVFILLFVFMIVLYYVMYMQPKPKPVATQTVLPPLSPVVTISPTVVASKSAVLTSSADIQIVSSAKSAASATRLRTVLTSIGAKTVTISAQAVTSPKTLIIFSSDIPTGDKELLFTKIQEVSSSAASQETTLTKNKVSITLGAN